MTNGFPATEPLAEGDVGPGTWSMYQDTDTFIITNRTSVNFPISINVTGTVISATGTNWLFVDHDNTNNTEALSYVVPGGSGSTFYKMQLTAFVRTTALNTSAGDVNLDFLLLDGNPFSYAQLVCASDSGPVYFKAHVNGANGGLIEIQRNHLYFVSLYRSDADGLARVKVWDAENNYALVGTSTSTGMATSGNSWWVRVQANYYDTTHVLTGWTEIAGLATIFGPDANDNAPVTTPVTTVNAGTVNAGTLVIQ